LKTIVYIDGYNLYYNRLSNTIHKWLDVVKLAELLVGEQDPGSTVELVRYFTAPILAKFARRGQDSQIAQQTYLRALSHVHPGRFDAVYGRHQGEVLPMMRHDPLKPPSKDDQVHVWRLVEKLTDVNLAMSMYRDVAKGACEQIVLFSNDTDAEPALAAIRADFPQVVIGVIAPLIPLQDASGTGRGDEPLRPMSGLKNQAHWIRRSIPDAALASAQLPAVIPTDKKAIKKPTHWHPVSAPDPTAAAPAAPEPINPTADGSA